MSEHLSDFVLDEVSVGGPPPAHLESCSACQGRLARMRSHAEALRATPDFAQVRARVRAEAARRVEPAPSRWRLGWWLVPALATAAAVLLVVRAPLTGRGGAGSGGSEVPGLRVKGAPAVELVRLADGQVNPVLREGDEVALRVRGGGHRYAWVVSQDVDGQVEALWPALGEWSGALDEVRMAPLFQVTRGDFVVHAFYSDVPLRLEEVRGWLASRGPKCLGEAREPACLALSGLPEGVAHAAEALKVETTR